MAPTDPMEILQIINSLKSKKTLGPDRVSTHLLKENGPEICTVLSMAVNKSISSGIVPTCLKIARITPIHKDKDKRDFSNYRPISILPSVSKILEQVIHKSLYHYMN